MSVDNNCFLTSPLKLLFFIDLVINIHREFNFVFISKFSLVINILKTFAWGSFVRLRYTALCIV